MPKFAIDLTDDEVVKAKELFDKIDQYAALIPTGLLPIISRIEREIRSL